jgi:hypothetical protein
MAESFRGLRKFFCELMLSIRIDNKNIVPPRRARRPRRIHSFYTFKLRALRDLRGEIFVSTLVAALALSGEYFFTMNP